MVLLLDLNQDLLFWSHISTDCINWGPLFSIRVQMDIRLFCRNSLNRFILSKVNSTLPPYLSHWFLKLTIWGLGFRVELTPNPKPYNLKTNNSWLFESAAIHTSVSVRWKSMETLFHSSKEWKTNNINCADEQHSNAVLTQIPHDCKRGFQMIF